MRCAYGDKCDRIDIDFDRGLPWVMVDDKGRHWHGDCAKRALRGRGSINVGKCAGCDQPIGVGVGRQLTVGLSQWHRGCAMLALAKL